jgi:flagellar hook protein FlgE
MSVGSFSASLSGLNVHQQKLGVIGNNLANLNTVGYKASIVQFSDLVSQSIGGASDNPMQIGLGVAVGQISPNFSQGGIESTGISTNVAIQGTGLFIVGDPAHRAYTRAGNFTFDANGVLVTPDGQPVQGYTAIDSVTGLIDTDGQPTNIVIPPGVLRSPTRT